MNAPMRAAEGWDGLVYTKVRGFVRLADGSSALLLGGDPVPPLADGELERLQHLGSVGETYDPPEWHPLPGADHVRIARRLAGLPVDGPPTATRGFPATDIDGVARPQGTNADAGAYEDCS